MSDENGEIVWEKPPPAAPQTRKPKRSKQWGSEVERATEVRIRKMFPEAERVGSLGYTEAHPDLIQDCEDGHPVINMVVVRDFRQPLLATVNFEDLELLVSSTPQQVADMGLRVQVKARQKTWIGQVYGALTRSESEDKVVRSVRRKHGGRLSKWHNA
jgi:hypothetical protein